MTLNLSFLESLMNRNRINEYASRGHWINKIQNTGRILILHNGNRQMKILDNLTISEAEEVNEMLNLEIRSIET